MANTNQWCFAWFQARRASAGADRAALQQAAKWNSGDLITVSFLDGDPLVQSRVRDAAMAWTGPGMANLTLDFRNDTNTLIRISFQFAGSWSMIGTTCRQVDLAMPTMNYGWLTPESDDAEVRSVVLHEFGHALGLIHEHQNPSPTGRIDWNRDAVIRDLSGPPNNWTPEQIEFNIFQAFDARETNFSDVDPQSIMMYPIPAHWTNSGFSVGFNSDLSPQDRQFIHEQYR